MFANFLYLLVALILYTTCQYTGTGSSMPDNALVMALFLVVVFVGICRLTFKRMERSEKLEFRAGLDIMLDKALSRLSVLALGMFAADLYLLRLKLLFSDIAFFKWFPTFEAVLFLGIFLGYLVIVWIFAWNFQRRIFASPFSKKNFVISNISFSLPALLPWFLLSLIADMIQVLPFEQPKAFLSSPEGEICYVLIFLFAVATFGPFLIQKLWRCRSMEPGPARERIQQLCSRAGLRYADILKWELFGGSMITAGVMGLVAKFRYILVTPALINLLEPHEVDAVIAHEIGHVQKNHILFYLFFFAGYIACVYSLFDPALLLIYYSQPLFDLVGFAGLDHETASMIFFSGILIAVFLVYFRYVFGFYMRNFERQADLHVYTLLGNSDALITTFYKIVRFSRQSADKPSWHHYSISQRINFLKQCQAEPARVLGHHRKVKIMVLGYAAAMVLVCAMGYSLNFGHAKDGFNRVLTEMVLMRQLEMDPDNSEVHILLGDYYYDSGKYKEAVNSYGRALNHDPENSHALNNLAWLFATCPDPEFRDREASLSLARKAIAVKREAFVLDTYAEACFLNGLYTEALEASQEALEKADDRLGYYKSQVERFRKRADSQSPVSP